MSDKSKKYFLTPAQCAEQFRLYAASNPSADSQHSLRFCANFLDEFCKQDAKISLALMTDSMSAFKAGARWCATNGADNWDQLDAAAKRWNKNHKDEGLGGFVTVKGGSI